MACGDLAVACGDPSMDPSIAHGGFTMAYQPGAPADDDGGSEPPGFHFRIRSLPRRSPRMATWNTASLWGAILTTGARQTAKRRMVDDVLLDSDVVSLQEVRVEADMTTLPPSHENVGTLTPLTAAGSSAFGGTLLAVSVSLTRAALHAHAVEHMSGHSPEACILGNGYILLLCALILPWRSDARSSSAQTSQTTTVPTLELLFFSATGVSFTLVKHDF